jgi:alkylation response protein AidB-like acyl-CoA dehydrogenase
VTTHQHIVLFAAWRFRRGMPGRRGAAAARGRGPDRAGDHGGSDWTRPNGTAVKVDGGWVVNGRKPFASQAPAADVFSMLFTAESTDGARQVIGASIPRDAKGLTIVDTWDTLGMRGTGSQDLVLADVFVPDAAANPPRPWGVIDPPLMAIGLHALPPITGVYLGLADAARDRAVAHLTSSPKAGDPLVQRQVGRLDGHLRMAQWALQGVLAEIGDDPEPSASLVASVFQAKRAIADELVAACDLAMEVVGGAGYFRKAGIEQAVRDVRALKYHPLPSDTALVFAGRAVLGQAPQEL